MVNRISVFSNRNRALRCGILFALCAAPLMAQSAGGDPLTNFLTQLMTLATGTWARLLVVLGVCLLACKYLFSDERDHNSLIKTVIGGALLIGAQSFASYWFH